jgi:hypothetical protein
MLRFIKASSLIVLTAAIFTAASTATAQTPLLVEDFNYNPGALLTDNGWTAHSGGGTNAIAAVSPGLTLAGYPGSGVGNAAGLTVSGEDVNRPFAIQSTGTVYAALMVNLSDASTDVVGGYFFHLGPDPVSTTFRGRLFAKKDGSNNVAFGISKAGTSEATVAYTPFNYSLNTTYLIVVKYQIVDGATNDIVTMYVSSTVPAAEPGTPTLTAIDTSATDISPGTVSLRQGSAATSPTLVADGIRVGTSWASVTAGSGPAGPTKVDFDGDGKSDYVITRPAPVPSLNAFELSGDKQTFPERVPMYKQVLGKSGSNDLGEPGTTKEWWIYNSGNGSFTSQGFGTGATGELNVPEDYDGDGKTDIAIWRAQSATGPGGAFFFVLNSSDNTITQTDFGVSGDNPTVTGDYDGDGKADPAVYRCPSFPPGGQCFYFYQGSNNNPGGVITYVPWGNNAPSDLFPNRGDFDGDGKLDFCVQRVNPSQAGQGQFVLLRSSDQGVEYINWDTSSALIVPGDYDGDGKSDIMTVRVVSSNLIWSLKTRTGVESYTQWGRTIAGFTEFIAQSDYDGDGKTDIAIYRRDNANPDNTYYWIIRSSDGGIQTFEWGAPGDTPVNGWDVN